MNNIYRILTAHYSQKDLHNSMMGFVLAYNDEQVFNWINTDPTIHNERVWGIDEEKLEEDNDYKTKDENYNTIQTFVNYKDYLIHVGGVINSDYEEYEDLYYGKTLFGWELFQKDVDYDFIRNSIFLGLIKDIRNI